MTARDPDRLIFDAGRKEGRQQMRVEVLTYLQEKYLDAPDRPDRNTPKAEAILELAAELAEKFK